MTTHHRLEGKVALVTGSPKKLGAAMARTLARAGARVIVNYNHSADDARALVEELRSAGFDAMALQADIADADAVHGLLSATVDTYGGLDVLINNAGPWTDTALRRVTPDAWDWIMNTNLRATWYVSREAFPIMDARGWGRIINVSAGSAHVRNHSVYGLAKTAVEALTGALALEFAPRVTVNAIAPGLIDDPELSDAHRVPAAAYAPLRRLVGYDDVSAMVLAMCSAAFDVVTGQTVIMDGGASIPTDPTTYDK